MTLTALVAGGHLEELALHTRAAVRNGLSAEEIAECVLHSAIYCGVPAANSALRVVQTTLAEGDDSADDPRRRRPNGAGYELRAAMQAPASRPAASASARADSTTTALAASG